jgi:hypothetical protein
MNATPVGAMWSKPAAMAGGRLAKFLSGPGVANAKMAPM